MNLFLEKMQTIKMSEESIFVYSFKSDLISTEISDVRMYPVEYWKL